MGGPGRPPPAIDQNYGLVVTALSSLPQTRGRVIIQILNFCHLLAPLLYDNEQSTIGLSAAIFYLYPHTAHSPADVKCVHVYLDPCSVGGCNILLSYTCVYRDRITLAVLELRENEDLAKLERTWWYDKGQCGSDGTFMKVCRC